MPPSNILLIHSDQHRFDCLGVAGHAQLRTPHLDALARQGVHFTSAFTPTAICTPARASLWTGLWPSQHRVASNPPLESYRPLDAAARTWSRELRDRGYWLGMVGKYHDELGSDPTAHGFHVFRDAQEYRAWRREQGLPPPQRTRGTFGYFGQPDVHAKPEQTRLAWGADRTIEVLETACASGQPWLVRWDPPEPHLPALPPEPFASMYGPASLSPWPSFHDTLANKPYIQRQQRHSWGVDGWTWSDWAPTVAYYLGVISELDAQVGRVLAALDRLGAADRTLVIYTTDHGDFCGGHGQMDKHFCMYDDLMRVPLIVRWPGELDGGRSCDAFAMQELDVAATIWRAAELDPPANIAGRDLRDVARGNVSRDAVFGQYSGAQLGAYTQRMIRTPRWKYIWNATDVDELYDLERDPGELINRIDDPSCAGELRELRQRLYAWMESIGDPMTNGWTQRQLIDGHKLGACAAPPPPSVANPGGQ